MSSNISFGGSYSPYRLGNASGKYLSIVSNNSFRLLFPRKESSLNHHDNLIVEKRSVFSICSTRFTPDGKNMSSV